MIRGDNFFMQLDEEVKRLGFYTNRFVQASGAAEVEQLAVAQIRKDPKLGSILNRPDDPPMLYVEEITEIEADSVPQSAQGFTFFPAESNA
jgi:hypothetical protein